MKFRFFRKKTQIRKTVDTIKIAPIWSNRSKHIGFCQTHFTKVKSVEADLCRALSKTFSISRLGQNIATLRRVGRKIAGFCRTQSTTFSFGRVSRHVATLSQTHFTEVEPVEILLSVLDLSSGSKHSHFESSRSKNS